MFQPTGETAESSREPTDHEKNNLGGLADWPAAVPESLWHQKQAANGMLNPLYQGTFSSRPTRAT
ncbi:hypothetical protein GQ53DRAFT_742208 [Thozetella sp. PMI_491]|nr:hypothetical protein GQ53DRAFT_742208 [Thozetella sp. PMI_491]